MISTCFPEAHGTEEPASCEHFRSLIATLDLLSPQLNTAAAMRMSSWKVHCELEVLTFHSREYRIISVSHRKLDPHEVIYYENWQSTWQSVFLKIHNTACLVGQCYHHSLRGSHPCQPPSFPPTGRGLFLPHPHSS